MTTAEDSKRVLDLLAEKLKQKGFGILSKIDVQSVLKDKTGADVGPYVILDVCKPDSAKKAIEAHPEIGMVLPCKILVRSEGKTTKVSLYRPTEMIVRAGFTDLAQLAREVEQDLKSVLEGVSATR